MHFSVNRTNHDFQIAYFIAGGCHTPDAAYGILCDLAENRSDAIKSYAASKLREQAKIIRANRLLASEDEADRLEGQADIVEIEAMAETVAKNLAAAEAELKTIRDYQAALQPLRKYAHLSLPEAHEAIQQEEWKLELIHRVENCLMTTGAIPTDQFSTMRMHPEFKTEILPRIERVQKLQHLMRLGDTEADRIAAQAAADELLGITTTRPFELPAMLTYSGASSI